MRSRPALAYKKIGNTAQWCRCTREVPAQHTIIFIGSLPSSGRQASPASEAANAPEHSRGNTSSGIEPALFIPVEQGKGKYEDGGSQDQQRQPQKKLRTYLRTWRVNSCAGTVRAGGLLVLSASLLGPGGRRRMRAGAGPGWPWRVSVQ